MSAPLFRLAELHPRDLEQRIAERPALILPVGTVEWHGHHLPLGLDGIKAEAIAAEAARRSGAVLAPTCWLAADGVPQPFTLRLARAGVRDLLAEMLCQFAGMGFAVLVIANGHYGLQNSLAAREAALACSTATDAVALAIAEYEVLLDLGAEGDHAGVFETSFLAALRPDLVRLSAGDPAIPLPGVIGIDPRGRASAELGHAALARAATRIAAAIDRALGRDFDRAAYREAITTAVAALRALEELRSSTPRELVPPVRTPSWDAHLRALDAGDFAGARAHAERKLRDPAS